MVLRRGSAPKEGSRPTLKQLEGIDLAVLELGGREVEAHRLPLRNGPPAHDWSTTLFALESRSSTHRQNWTFPSPCLLINYRATIQQSYSSVQYII